MEFSSQTLVPSFIAKRHGVSKNRQSSACASSARMFSTFDVQAFLIGLLVTSLFVGCNDRKSSRRLAPAQPALNANRVQPKMSDVLLRPAELQRRRDEQLLSAKHDGWKSEAFADSAKKELLSTFKEASATRKPERSDTESNATESTSVHPALKLSFENDNLQVFHASETEPLTRGIPRALSHVVAHLSELGKPRLAVKVIRVDMEPRQPTTTAIYEASAKGNAKSIQQTAEIDCIWNLDSKNKLQLVAIKWRDFEEVHYLANNGRWLTDCTNSVLAEVPALDEQFSFGLNYWSERIERSHGMDDSVRNGLSIGDVNGDGRQDIYVCQGPGLPNRLLVQSSDGRLKDVSKDAGVDILDQTSSSLLLDLDNDGDQDLAIATTSGIVIFENNSKGEFKIRTRLGVKHCDPQSLSAADFDQDGFLDIFLCVYRPDRAGRKGDFVFHDATTGGKNRLYRNELKSSNWKFEDVTAEVGLDVGATRYSLASAWEDFDGDGDQDLYVANDYGRNFLYRNDGGKFTDATNEAGLSDTGFGMSVGWGDANRDGVPDLYIGNMFSSAGSRITRQARFQENSSGQQKALYQRMAQGNSLFLGSPDRFVDVSRAAKVQMGRWAWSSIFADLNNDGWEDLLVANGYITAEDSTDL